MKIYLKMFAEYNQPVAQILLTRDVMNDDLKNINARNTVNTLIDMKVIPVINENDTVATDEIEHLGYGDNDRLSADVACLIHADLLIILSDIDGLFSGDPKKDNQAKIINKVVEITPEIEDIALGPNSEFAKGGMSTKIIAAKTCAAYGIHTIIMNGKTPGRIINLLNGEEVGTLLLAKK
jgi:glutamate 5-kinase